MSKSDGKCRFKLNIVPLRIESVEILFLGVSGDGVVYDGWNNGNHEECKVFLEDCLAFDIMMPVQ